MSTLLTTNPSPPPLDALASLADRVVLEILVAPATVPAALVVLAVLAVLAVPVDLEILVAPVTVVPAALAIPVVPVVLATAAQAGDILRSALWSA